MSLPPAAPAADARSYPGLGAMAATMQAEAAEAKAEAAVAAEWRERMLAGQQLMLNYMERTTIAAEASAAAVVALEARAAAF